MSIRTWTVVVREYLVVGRRSKAEAVDKNLTVRVSTRHAARNAVLNAGYRGKIIDIFEELE